MHRANCLIKKEKFERDGRIAERFSAAFAIDSAELPPNAFSQIESRSAGESDEQTVSSFRIGTLDEAAPSTWLDIRVAENRSSSHELYEPIARNPPPPPPPP